MLAPDQAMILAALGADLGPEEVPAGFGSIFTTAPESWGSAQFPFTSQPEGWGNSMAMLMALAPELADPRKLLPRMDTMGEFRPQGQGENR